MHKHLICLDLDGTLLTHEKKISPYTKKVLMHLKEMGHEIMISTGRPYRASEPYYRELEMSTPVVNFNGAFVHHPQDLYFKTVHEELDLEVAKEIVDRVPDLNIQNIIAEVMDNVYIHYHDEVLFEDRKSTRLNSSHVAISYTILCSFLYFISFPRRRSSDLLSSISTGRSSTIHRIFMSRRSMKNWTLKWRRRLWTGCRI